MKRFLWRTFWFDASLIAIFFLNILTSVECYASIPDTFTPLISISSDRFTSGDDLRFASPSFDDSGWRTLGNNASINSESVSVWRRIRFVIPKDTKDHQVGILLGRIADADEVYLNGVKIGGEDLLGDHFVKTDKVVRLYQLPLVSLKPEGENLLAVRTVNLSPTKSNQQSPVIGDYNALLKIKLKEEYSTRNIEFVLFTFFFIWIEYMCFLYYKRLVTNEYTSFGLFMIIYAVAYFLDSLIFYQTGFKTDTIQHIITALYFVLPATILYFQMCVYKHKLKAWTWINLFAPVILSLAALFVDDLRTQRVLLMLWYPVCISVAATALLFAWQDYHQKLNESKPMFAGMLWICLSGGISLLSCTTTIITTYTLFGYNQSVLILFVWIIIMKYGIISRFARIKIDMQTMSSRLLSAHEDERSRLARDLHDGMGQNLVAVKFNLQRVNTGLNNRLIDGVIEEISGNINDLRDISTGLMPASLKAVGLANLLKTHAVQFSKNSGICVVVETDEPSRLPLPVELNIFRIFQEVLNNAAKHSGATNISVSLKEESNGLAMQIHDDGSGFDIKSVQANNQGLGLSIMQERVRIIGGDITMQSGRNIGTTIILEVPFS